MSFMNKIKTLFTEEVEEEPIKSEVIQVEIPAPEAKIKEDNIADTKALKVEEKTPIFFNDDDFKELEKEIQEKPKPVVKSSYMKEKPTIKKEEKKVFKPTPIISPVYGVLDKNYSKEDITAKTPRKHQDTATLNLDDVRKKAYGTLEDDLENTLFGSNSILFNDEVEIEDKFEDDNLLEDLTDVTDVIELDEEVVDDEIKNDDLFDLVDSIYEKGEE